MPMKNPPHPGGAVKDCIEELGLSVTEAAKILGVARPTLSRIINGQSGISPEMALRLSMAFGSTPEMWLRLQSAYDLAQTRLHVDLVAVKRYEPAQHTAGQRMAGA
jgi:addiction module HigA family antidote